MGNSFPTTKWSVLVGGEKADRAARQAALEYLAAAYWEPIYAFVRRRGHDVDGARDLTQSFFLGLLDGRLIDQANPNKGRFRAYLATAVGHFLINQHVRASTQRRAPDAPVLSLDTIAAEQRFRVDPVEELTPEQVFERRWAQSLIRRALDRLRAEQEEAGHGDHFGLLRHDVVGDKTSSYPELAERLDLSEAALRKMVSRMRRRFGEILRAEVADTVVDLADVDSEIRHLLAVAVF